MITCDKYKHIVKRGLHNDIESCFKDTIDINQMVVFDINDVYFFIRNKQNNVETCDEYKCWNLKTPTRGPQWPSG